MLYREKCGFYSIFFSLLRPPRHCRCYNRSVGCSCTYIILKGNTCMLINRTFVAPKSSPPHSRHTIALEARWRETRVDNPKTRPSARRCRLLSSLVYCPRIPLTKLTVDGRHLAYNPPHSALHGMHINKTQVARKTFSRGIDLQVYNLYAYFIIIYYAYNIISTIR